MAEGSKIGWQGNVPLDGESNIVQTLAGLASDVLTITGATGQTGDYFVCQNSAGTEKAYITSVGGMYLASSLAVTGQFGCNGQTARASGTVSAALGTTSGSYGCSSSADWILMVNMINNIRSALVSCGICSSTA